MDSNWLLFMGLCKPNRNKRANPNWNKRAHLKGPLRSYISKVVEKENPNPRELHKVFFLKS